MLLRLKIYDPSSQNIKATDKHVNSERLEGKQPLVLEMRASPAEKAKSGCKFVKNGTGVMPSLVLSSNSIGFFQPSRLFRDRPTKENDLSLELAVLLTCSSQRARFELCATNFDWGVCKGRGFTFFL